MNIEEWYKETFGVDFDDTLPSSVNIKIGWHFCKQEALQILKKPLKNLDLSEDFCDNRYIEEIEKL